MYVQCILLELKSFNEMLNSSDSDWAPLSVIIVIDVIKWSPSSE